jgi:hypothetical protein
MRGPNRAGKEVLIARSIAPAMRLEGGSRK